MMSNEIIGLIMVLVAIVAIIILGICWKRENAFFHSIWFGVSAIFALGIDAMGLVLLWTPS